MVKESTGDIGRMHRLAQLSDGEIPFYNGSNPIAALAAGAAGWCTAAPNLNAALPLALFDAMQAGDLARARTVFHAQLPLLQFIVNGGLPVTVKAGLRLRGFDAGEPRKPLMPLGDARARTRTPARGAARRCDDMIDTARPLVSAAIGAVRVGKRRPLAGTPHASAIDKQPVDTRLWLGTLGFAGDEQPMHGITAGLTRRCTTCTRSLCVVVGADRRARCSRNRAHSARTCRRMA